MKIQERRLFIVYSLNTLGHEPITIRPGKPLYFTEKKNAEDVLLRFKELYSFLYEENPHGEHVYCLVLEEFELDSPYRYQLSTSVYSPDGMLLSDCIVPDDGPFLGRPEQKILHEIGEVVELPFGDQLVFGIVVGQPMTFNENARTYGLTASDDCYMVIHHQSKEVNYAHAPMVFKPTREVTEEVRIDLMSSYQQIEESKGL